MATKFISSISDSDFEKSKEAGRRLVVRGLLAVAAAYASKRIRAELDNGCFFEFPCEHAQGFRGAKAADLKVIEIQASGLGLHWPKLDADLYVPAVVKGVLGSKNWMAQIGATGGAAKSEKKIPASRQNGTKMGRPCKKALVA